MQREVDAAGLVEEAHVGSQVFVGRLRWSEMLRRRRWKSRRSAIDGE